MRPAVILMSMVVSAAVAAGPLPAQTPDVWMNQKISDMRRHQHEVPSQAAEHYETAQRYMVRIDRLTRKAEDGELSKRQQKKLDRAFRKAIEELEAAIEEAPDWIDSRLALASVYYKRGDLQEARTAYRELLAVDPENEKAQAYLNTVEYELERQDHDGA